MLTQTVSQFDAHYEENGQFLDLEARPVDGGWHLIGLDMAREYSSILASTRNPAEPRVFASMDSLITLARERWPDAELSVQLWARAE